MRRPHTLAGLADREATLLSTSIWELAPPASSLPSMAPQLVEIARTDRKGLKVLAMTGCAAETAARSGLPEAGMDMVAQSFQPELLAIKNRDMTSGAETQ